MTTLLTAAQAAERLGISEDQMKRRSAKENWPSVRFSSRTIRYSEAHIEQIIAAHEGKVALVNADDFGQTDRSKAKSA